MSRSEDDKLLVARARKYRTFLWSADVCGGEVPRPEGQYVSTQETVRGFREILDGKHDDLPSRH